MEEDVRMIATLSEPQIFWLAAALPLLAAGLVLLIAASLRRRGRFDGGPGYLHGLGRYFGAPRVRELALDVAALGSSTLVTIFTTLLALAWLLAGDVPAALLLALASALAAALGTLLKRLTRRLRPGEATAVHFGSSFPSSHTLMGTTLYGTAATLLWLDGRWPLLALLAAVAAGLAALTIGFSRVVLRVHYLSDVTAGWLMAASLVASIGLLYSAALHTG